MKTPNENISAFEIIKNYLPAIIMIGAGFVSLVLTWKNVNDNTEGLRQLKDQVQKQYSTQRDMNDKTNKEVDDLKLWRAYEEGKKDALKNK